MRRTVTSKDEFKVGFEKKMQLYGTQLSPVCTSNDIDKLLSMPDWRQRCAELLNYCDELLGFYFCPETQAYHRIETPSLTLDQLISLAVEEKPSKQPVLPVPPTPLQQYYLNYLGTYAHRLYKKWVLSLKSGLSPEDQDSSRTGEAISRDLHTRQGSKQAGKKSGESGGASIFSVKLDNNQPSTKQLPQLSS